MDVTSPFAGSCCAAPMSTGSALNRSRRVVPRRPLYVRPEREEGSGGAAAAAGHRLHRSFVGEEEVESLE